MSKIWAISAYFNPLSEQARLRNYKQFYAQLQVPLLTVELAFDKPHLTSRDADRFIYVRQGGVMWQKERLLNIALEQLPEDCEAVAWLDADLIFENKKWPTDCLKELERVPMIQLFDIAVRSKLEFTSKPKQPRMSVPQFLPQVQNDQVSLPVIRGGWNSTCGFAWAARLESIRKYGFYDAGIVGGGDRNLLCAAMGAHLELAAYRNMSLPMISHYRNWANSFYQEIKGQVSSIPGNVLHLPHGKISSRKYTERHKILNQLNYQPLKDVEIGPHGTWEWTGHNPALEAYLMSYFETRAQESMAA